MRVLLDTGVLAAGIVGGPLELATPPAQIWRHWEGEKFDLLFSRHLLEELNRTLLLPWFTSRIDPSSRDLALLRLRRFAELVTIDTFASGITSHAEDDLILAAAVSGKADYLVTGDAEFLRVREYQGVKLRTPVDFLREFEAQST